MFVDEINYDIIVVGFVEIWIEDVLGWCVGIILGCLIFLFEDVFIVLWIFGLGFYVDIWVGCIIDFLVDGLW